MSKDYEITVCVSVPDDATDEDVKAYFDVEFAGFNSFKIDNPVNRDGYDAYSLDVESL